MNLRKSEWKEVEANINHCFKKFCNERKQREDKVGSGEVKKGCIFYFSFWMSNSMVGF